MMKNGKIAAIRHRDGLTEVTLQNQDGTSSYDVKRAEDFAVGDIVGINLDEAPPVATLLTKSLRPGERHFMDRTLDPRRLHALRIRNEVEGGIRAFFLNQGFLETRTPLLVPCPGMEIHVRPFHLETGAFLPTSPEFAMKRLLTGGLEKIFQICPSFRYEPNSNTHHPEFTMLEWYRAYSNVEAIQTDTERLVESLAMRIHGRPELSFQGQKISVKTPWPRLRVRDLFSKLGVDLVKASSTESLRAECTRLGLTSSATDTWDDLYFRIWMNLIEPKLPADQAVFVERYPKSQAALAVLDEDSDGSVWAKRFEFYIAGLELGNAFEELTDAKEQRARFERDMVERTQIYGSAFPPSPLDEDFLRALEEGLPPSGGIAVGVDRLVMLLADEPELEKTIWLPSFPGTTEPSPIVGA
jgi:elongation factor P--(R)-beta-lysine ligase